MFSITNHAHQRELIVAEFINSFERLLKKLNDESNSIIDAWLNHCLHLNKKFPSQIITNLMKAPLLASMKKAMPK